MPRWTHPIHARGVRTGRTDFSGGGALTDAAITRYIRLGYYGEGRRRALLDSEKEKRAPRRGPLALALALLSKL